MENNLQTVPEARSVQFMTGEQAVAQATQIANVLKSVIENQKLYAVITGRKYVTVEGWTTLGAMGGIMPRELSVIEKENGDFEAVVELIRVSDGAVVGRGSALCGADEATWKSRPKYARRSMSITRATGKAFRLGYSWVIKMAGYEATPAEEMIDVKVAEVKKVPSSVVTDEDIKDLDQAFKK